MIADNLDTQKSDLLEKINAANEEITETITQAVNAAVRAAIAPLEKHISDLNANLVEKGKQIKKL